MDFVTLRSEVRERVGESVGDFWSDTYINRQLNEAVRRFSNEERWPWLYTEKTGVVVSAGTATLALEKDVSPTRHFDLLFTVTGNTAPRTPMRVNPPEGYELRRTNYTSGEPQWFYLVKGVQLAGGDAGKMQYTIRFVPTPNIQLTVEYQYIRVPVDLVSDADIPDVPVQYHEALVAWATGEAWLKELNGGGKAQEQFNLYNKVVGDARRDMKALALGERLVWGGEQPDLTAQDLEEWRRRIPPTLG